MVVAIELIRLGAVGVDAEQLGEEGRLASGAIGRGEGAELPGAIGIDVQLIGGADLIGESQEALGFPGVGRRLAGLTLGVIEDGLGVDVPLAAGLGGGDRQGRIGAAGEGGEGWED
jgi:hypothetical protein